MQFGWQGLIRTVVLTAVVTSACWVLLGVWWMNRIAPRAGPAPVEAALSGPAVPGAEPAAQAVAMVSPIGEVPVRRLAPLPDRLTIPVQGVAAAQLVDTFAEARAAGMRRHDAIDIMAPLGTPVIAAAPGRVEKLFLSKDGGNTVYQRSADGRTIYYYAHLAAYAPGLAEGQMLARGSPVGTVGYSGNANPAAPHLHFAVMQTTPQARWWDPSTAVDPYPLLGGRAKPARPVAPGPGRSVASARPDR